MTRLPYDVFISHSSHNSHLAEAICHTLESHRIRCWIAPRNVGAGEEWAGSINQGIKNSRIMLLIFTAASNTSQQVRKEITLAVNERKIIIPFRAEDCPMSNEMEYYLCDTHWLDAYPNPESKFPKLVQTLSAFLGMESVSAAGADAAAPEPVAEQTGATIHIETDLDCRVLQFGKELCTARAGEDMVIRLRKGKHKLEFVSLAHADDRYETIFPVEDNEMEDFLPVNLTSVHDQRRLSIPDNDIAPFLADGKYGYKVKSTGEVLVAPKYADARLFRGLALVKADGKYGFIDKIGNEVIPLRYDDSWPFHEGLAAVSLNGKYGFIDTIGNEVIPFRYDGVIGGGFCEGLASVKSDGKYGLIDKTGKTVIPFQFNVARPCHQGLIAVASNGKWGFIDLSNRVVIPFQYAQADSFGEGLAPVTVTRNGRWGYIDRSNRVVIPFQYDEADMFHEGLARVKKDGKWGLIDPSGNEVFPIRYDGAYFSEGLAYVKLNGEWFYIDKNGNRVEKN